jgi:hypothetical protein
MRGPRICILTAWLLQLVAWLLPTANIFGFPFTGWEAFWATLSSTWPGKESGSVAWYEPLLAGITTLTTLFFVLGSPWIVWRGSRSLQRASAWIMAGAFAFNAHWWMFGDLTWRELRVGYLFWWFSFGLLAIGLFALVTGQLSERSPLLSRQPENPAIGQP